MAWLDAKKEDILDEAREVGISPKKLSSLPQEVLHSSILKHLVRKVYGHSKIGTALKLKPTELDNIQVASLSM